MAETVMICSSLLGSSIKMSFTCSSNPRDSITSTSSSTSILMYLVSRAPAVIMCLIRPGVPEYIQVISIGKKG